MKTALKVKKEQEIEELNKTAHCNLRLYMAESAPRAILEPYFCVRRPGSPMRYRNRRQRTLARGTNDLVFHGTGSVVVGDAMSSIRACDAIVREELLRYGTAH